MAFKRKHARNSRNRRRSGGLSAGTPLPAPAFVTAASIEHDGSPAIGEQLLGIDGVANYSIVSRRWLLGSTVLATTHALTAQVGVLVFESLARSPDGREAVSQAQIVIGDGSSANITSPSTYSQPAGTLRYQQAAANKSGSFSKGGGGDSDLFTVNPLNGMWSISETQEAGAKTLPLVFTPDDGSAPSTQTVTVTLLPADALTDQSQAFSSDFIGAAGAALITKAGWSLKVKSGSTGPYDLPTLSGDGRLRAASTLAYPEKEGDWALVQTFTKPRAGSEYRWRFEASAGGDTNAGIWVLGNGALNGIGFRFRLATLASGYAYVQATYVRQNGTPIEVTTSSANAGGAYAADGSVDVIARVSADGNTFTLHVAGAGGEKLVSTIDLTQYSGLGNEFGLSGRSPYVSNMRPDAVLRSLSAQSTSTTLAITGPVSTVGMFADFSIAWSRRQPRRYRHRFRASKNAPWSSWLLGESVVNANGSSTYKATYPARGAYQTQIAPDDDISAIYTVDSTMVGYGNLAFEMGYNQGIGAYFAPVNPFNNFGKFIDIRNHTNQMLWPYEGIVDDYTAVSNPGVTLTTSSDSRVQILASDPVTGRHSFKVTEDAPANNNRAVNFTGAPLEYFTVTRIGKPEQVAQEWIDSWEDHATTWRDLDASGANGVPYNGKLLRNVATDKYYNAKLTTGGMLPFADEVDTLAAAMTVKPNLYRLWHVIGPDQTDADIRADFEYFRDHPTLPKRAKLRVELSNERPWGALSFSGALRTLIEGSRAGFGRTSAKYNAPGPLVNSTYYLDVTPPAVVTPAGQKILSSQSGVAFCAIYTAKQDVPAGTPVTNTTYWERDTTHSGELASKQWHGVRMMQIIAIAKDVFGSAYDRRFEHALMGQAPASLNTALATELYFHPGYLMELQRNGCIGNAWYFDHGTDIDYNAGVATIQAQIEAGYEARFSVICGFIQSFVNEALALGIVPGSYEGLDHCNFGSGPGYQDQSRPAYKTAHDAYQASAVGRAMMARRIRFMRQNFPGVACGYTSQGGAPWATRYRLGDVNNPRRLGVIDGLTT